MMSTMSTSEAVNELSTTLTPRERLLALVRKILGPQAATRPLAIDARLPELGISSLKMVSLMLAIEAEFDLAIPQAEITPENFSSIASVAAMIERLLASLPQPR
jgi:acyl carrier protein